MATITSASSGNFSAPATWVGGVVPGPADDAVAANTHVVAIDVDVTVISFQQAGTGKFTLGNGRTVTGNVIANAGTFTSGGTIEVTATTGNSATINGNITGISSTAANIAAVVVAGTGTLILNGAVTGSAGNATSEANGHAGVYTNVSSTVTISGVVTGGSGSFKFGVFAGANATSAVLTINNNVIAGNASNAHAVFTAGASTQLTINGAASGFGSFAHGAYTTGATAQLVINGNVTGGSTDARGAYATGTSATITIVGNVTGGSSTNAWGVGTTGNLAAINITGNVRNGIGLVAHGAAMQGTTATLSITGSLIPSGTGTGYPVFSSASSVTLNLIGDILSGITTCVIFQGANSVINVTGNVTSSRGSGLIGISSTGASSTVNVIGNVTSNIWLSHGISSSATTNGVILQGSMTDAVDGSVAVYARVFRMTATPTGVTKYASGVNNPFGTLVSRIPASNTTGMPAQTNVRLNTVYGDTSQFTGTVAMPSTSQVMYGVPVDGSTGTAQFDLTSVASIIEAQVSAGAYERTTI